MIAPAPKDHVIIKLAPNINFLINYGPQIEYRSVRDMHNSEYSRMYGDNNKIEVFTGNTDIAGKLSVRIDDTSWVHYVTRHAIPSLEEDSRYIRFKDISISQVDWEKEGLVDTPFDPNTRLINYEKQLFDDILGIFNGGYLVYLQNILNILKSTGTSADINWDDALYNSWGI